ncbi:type II secretion system protein GspM [Jannaschia sp. KMU-145]|uniref:type II secretion system protein GspM n=1 Tax=Jannaschia halovivens TaxID=3388667 RepID=UPI00396B0871
MDSRTALLNAPRALRLAVAAATPVLTVALVAGAVMLARDRLDATAARIAAERANLGNLQRLIAATPGATAPRPADAPEFLPGASPALIQAAFQGRLGEIAAASGVDLLAVGNAPVTERDGTRFAGLRARMSGTNAEIVETVFAIESAVPYQTIRTARIDAATAPGDPDAADPTILSMELLIEGALPPDLEVAQ